MASARNRGFNLRWQGESEERAPPWLRCTAFHLPSRARRRSERRIQRHFLLRRWHTCRLMNRGGNSIVRRIRNAPNWRRRGGGEGGRWWACGSHSRFSLAKLEDAATARLLRKEDAPRWEQGGGLTRRRAGDWGHQREIPCRRVEVPGAVAIASNLRTASIKEFRRVRGSAEQDQKLEPTSTEEGRFLRSYYAEHEHPQRSTQITDLCTVCKEAAIREMLGWGLKETGADLPEPSSSRSVV